MPAPSPASRPRFSVWGVPVRLHFTFLLLLAFLLFAGANEGVTTLNHVLYILSLFASVFLHEIAHAVAARRYGIRTVEILMLPFGGMARLERQPRQGEEMVIAFAGPLLNLILGGALVAASKFFGGADLIASMQKPVDGNLLERIAAGNLALGLFNLLPAFPLDGGRMLRAYLAGARPETEATRIASRVGIFFAILFALYGLWSKDFFLVFTGFFLYAGAAQESVASTGRELIRGAKVREAMITDFRTLNHSQTIREAGELLLATSQQDFPVLAGGEVAGVLTRSDLLRAMALVGPEAYVAASMNRDYVALDPDVELETAMPQVAAGACALVMRDGRLEGILTNENLSEFLVLRQIGRMRP